MGTDVSTKPVAAPAEATETFDPGCSECFECSGSEIVYAVTVEKSRMGVETIQAYGLTITLDANGDAARVEFPHGAEVLS